SHDVTNKDQSHFFQYVDKVSDKNGAVHFAVWSKILNLLCKVGAPRRPLGFPAANRNLRRAMHTGRLARAPGDPVLVQKIYASKHLRCRPTPSDILANPVLRACETQTARAQTAIKNESRVPRYSFAASQSEFR